MRIGTRGSALARAQAESVARLLGRGELVTITTAGDRGADHGDKSRWVAELERALLDGEIDLAVHSAKDIPGQLAPGTELLAACERAAPEDVLCGAPSLRALAPGARVGTGSVRRIAQLRAEREDLEVVPLAGNVDTRLRKLADPAEGLSAIVLARAGLQRLRRQDEAGATLDPRRFVPAPGQGILALQGRRDDARAREAARPAADACALACLTAERTLARELDADCHTPLGAFAEPAGGGSMLLRAWVGLPDGSAWVGDALSRAEEDPEGLGREVAARLRGVGAAELLERARTIAASLHA